MHDLRVSRYLPIGRCTGDRSNDETVTSQKLKLAVHRDSGAESLRIPQRFCTSFIG